MKRRIDIRYILIAILYLFLNSCSSKSSRYEGAGESASDMALVEEMALEPEQANANEFEKEEISIIGLEAYETRAIQKVNDLADYITLVSDTAIETEFIDQAKSMAIAMFPKNNTITIVSGSDNKNTTQIRLKGFIKVVEQGQPEAYSFKFKDIRIEKALSKERNNRYRGLLKCSLESSSPIVIDAISVSECNAEIEIIVKKISKAFGNTQKEIWEVFLGDILLTREE